VAGELDFIPHGIHQDTFFDRGRDEGRAILGVESDKKLVGCVMTNQARKDWGVWAQTARLLINKDPSYHFWAHVDLLERYWSLPALIEDFGLSNNVHITQSVTDETLAKLYSACDVTILPSLGEGFGYPLAESMACGVPAIHTSYGAGPEIINDTKRLVAPLSFRLDTLHNLFRPNLSPKLFADNVVAVLREPKEDCRAQVEHLFWSNLAPVWKHWFKKGLNA
jgi:glycosyltransferase involved in cell wall biosynthesis